LLRGPNPERIHPADRAAEEIMQLLKVPRVAK
jgi:hypothetical protein